MAATTRNDASWLQTGWQQNPGRSSQMRHYRAPAPCQKGASRNSLLQCNKMSVKTKQVEDRARQIRFKYGKNKFEKELNEKNGTDLTPFVTKVQIRKIHERSRFNSAERTSARRKNESEKVHTSFIENSEKNGQMIDSTLNGDKNDEEFYCSLEPVEEKDETYEESVLSEDIIAIQVSDKIQTDNYLDPETSETQLENVQHLIKYLTRRLRDPFEASRKQIPSTRPIAAYARPTKGEIALSVKGPVLLAPVTKVAMTTLRSHSPDNPNTCRIEARSLLNGCQSPRSPHFLGQRQCCCDREENARPLASHVGSTRARSQWRVRREVQSLFLVQGSLWFRFGDEKNTRTRQKCSIWGQ